jgi:hypothetical protein|tara:strand:- start:2480 stop:2968 length:489 start_codon:yes stop_codon:yes gene_type:complete
MTRIYEQLNTKTLGDVESIDIQSLQSKVHIQEFNKEELETYNLINQATFRSDSGIIPNKGKIVQTTGDSDRIQFQPELGECWKFAGGDILEQATGTFTVNFQLRDLDGNIAFIGSASSTGQEPITTDNLYKLNEIELTNSLYLYADITSGTGRISTAFLQIR